MSTDKNCQCCGGTKLIFSCSGAADVGELADRSARKLTQDGVGKMFCLAGIGGRVSGIMKTTESADKILAIDGCPLNCVKNSLELAGFQEFQHLQLAELRLEKGKTEVSEETIAMVAAKCAELMLGDPCA